MIKRRQCIAFTIGSLGGYVGSSVWGSGNAVAKALSSLHHAERVMLGFGATLHLQAWHHEAGVLDQALDSALAELRRVEALMSIYRESSQVSQLNRDGFLHQPDPRLLEVLRLAQNVSASSDGAFDITMQPLWTLWNRHSKLGKVPSPASLQSSLAAVGWRHLRLDPHIQVTKPGVQISLNGIAQGYAADRVKSVFESFNIRAALANVGETSALGLERHALHGTLGIDNPVRPGTSLLDLYWDGRSVATSSDANTHFTEDRIHHHIVDPRTGRSPSNLSGVTVVAKQAALADALTKVFFMLEQPLNAPSLQAKVRQLCQRWQVEVLLVDKQGNCLATAGLPVERAYTKLLRA